MSVGSKGAVLRRMCGVCLTYVLSGSAQAQNYFDSHNREWLRLSVVSGATWNAIDSVCQNASEPAGPCRGMAGGYDLTGWTWASRGEVASLIQSFMVAAGDNTDPRAILSQHGHGTQTSGWAAVLVEKLGRTGADRTTGFMNGLDSPTTGHLAFVCTGNPCGHLSYAGAGPSASVPTNTVSSGWFYRVAQAPNLGRTSPGTRTVEPRLTGSGGRP